MRDAPAAPTAALATARAPARGLARGLHRDHTSISQVHSHTTGRPDFSAKAISLSVPYPAPTATRTSQARR